MTITVRRTQDEQEWSVCLMVIFVLLLDVCIGSARAGDAATTTPAAPATPAPSPAPPATPPTPPPATPPPTEPPLAIPVDPDDADPAIPPPPAASELPDQTLPPIDVIEPIEARERTLTGFQWGTFLLVEPPEPAAMYDGGFRMWLDRDHRILEIGATVGFAPATGDPALAIGGEFGMDYAFRAEGTTGFIGGGGGLALILAHGETLAAAVPYGQGGLMVRHRGRVSVWGGRIDAPVQLGGWEGHYVPYARIGLFYGLGW